jgi:hypothetical protein
MAASALLFFFFLLWVMVFRPCATTPASERLTFLDDIWLLRGHQEDASGVALCDEF